ncbi:murein biosynthesis integral membrane protein MurJ [Microbacterium sp. STN6]|uniref:murein biosynthesis integral membrane protein MurJ n=1 Tax=Microbacterium sp. STN6 TaxID=2995588 RepID=UPI002260FB73|nr:murein biosynthesis integral membrane protein MurJ [Microbacterium sp. STN6]MCX7522771.1 murein biosynthesis integral membrane protein MurJ [Microbacterium sp. STN6]
MAEVRRASAVLAAGTMVSRVLGFVNMFVLALAIGTYGSAANSFAAANQLPNTIYVIVAGGVLNAVLVPQIVRAGLHADGGRAYINKLLTIAIVILGLTTLVATALAPVLVRVTVSGFNEAQTNLATVFAFWCLPQIFFYGMYTVLGEVLNARSVFGPFTWAPVFNNVIAIIGFALFMLFFGSDPEGARTVADFSGGMITTIGATATLGVATQAIVLILFWRRSGLSFRPDFHWRGVGLREVGRMASWTFGMLMVTTLTGVVQSNVASLADADDPSVSVLSRSWLIFMLPHSIVTVSIATAYFTRMSAAGASGRMSELKADISAAIRAVTLLIMAATAGLIVLAFPFARLFTKTFYQTQSMGFVIIANVVGLLSFTLLFVVQRAFYALGDTKTPFYFTLAEGIVFTLILIGCAMLPSPYIAIGVALGQSVATTVQMALAWYLLRRRIGTFDGRRIGASLTRYAVAAVPAALLGWLVLTALGATHDGGFGVSGKPQAVVTMIAAGAVVAAVYFSLLIALRVPELRGVLAPLAARIRRR